MSCIPCAYSQNASPKPAAKTTQEAAPAPAKPGQSNGQAPAKPGEPVVTSPAAKPAGEPTPSTKAGHEPTQIPAKPGQETRTPAKPGEAQEPKYKVEDFTFNPEGARNPFEPLLLLKAKSSRGLTVKTSTRAKTQKQPDKLSYELEELRLVGVIKSGTGMIAMMEDGQGKGVFFRKGDHLNKNMWVVDVSASSVVLGYKARGETKKITVDIPTKN